MEVTKLSFVHPWDMLMYPFLFPTALSCAYHTVSWGYHRGNSLFYIGLLALIIQINILCQRSLMWWQIFEQLKQENSSTPTLISACSGIQQGQHSHFKDTHDHLSSKKPRISTFYFSKGRSPLMPNGESLYFFLSLLLFKLLCVST
jgi:hypothetical protein